METVSHLLVCNPLVRLSECFPAYLHLFHELPEKFLWVDAADVCGTLFKDLPDTLRDRYVRVLERECSRDFRALSLVLERFEIVQHSMRVALCCTFLSICKSATSHAQASITL